MTRKRPYRRQPPRKRYTRAKFQRRKKPTGHKFIDVVSKTIRLLILIGICGFIIYRLFLAEKKTTPKKKQPVEIVAPPADTMAEEPIKKKVDLKSLSREQALDYLLKEVFNTFNLDDSWITQNRKVVKVQLPADLPAVTIIWEIIQRIEKLDLNVISSEEDLKANKSSIIIGTDENTLRTIVFQKNETLTRKAGKIAIIIDDFGYYDNHTTERFLKLNYPITLSIIPGQKYSAQIAQEAKKYAKPIIIHLPMEALEEEVEDSDFTIMSDMPDSVIASRVKRAIAFLPDAVGINNHMGSKATANSRVVSIVMNELKSRGKFFVDSKTTSQSAIPALAQRYDVRYAINEGFLERKRNEDEDYIQRKLAAVASIAKKRGKAVIIGHPYKETIEVLSEEIPRLEKQGFKFVPVTEVVR